MAIVEFKGYNTIQFHLLVFCETVFLIDMIINFFMQPLNGQGNNSNLSLYGVAYGYLKGKFMQDFIALLPFGALKAYHVSLRSLWLLKLMRVREMI